MLGDELLKVVEFVPWKVMSALWAINNLVIAQVNGGDGDLLGTALTIAGVTVPFGVGWVWNRQWADSVRRQNDFLKEEVGVLRNELVQERQEKLEAHDQADAMRIKMSKIQEELAQANEHRYHLEKRIVELERLLRMIGADIKAE